MNELNRYMLRQLMGPFGFFLLVFAGILWLTQSLRLFDTLISNGQSAAAFLEFSTLVLPNVMVFVVPLATFAAALYTLNKLYVESELVVILMAGRGPWSLVAPLLAFGLVSCFFLLAFTLFLVPASRTQLEERLQDVRLELTNSLIVEGRFGHPSNDVTTFIQSTNNSGEMSGIFIHDARKPVEPVTYTANRAVLVESGEEAQIVMFDGVIQKLDARTDRFSTLTFERFAFDLSEFVRTDAVRDRRPSEYYLLEALFPTEDDLNGRWSKGDFLAVAHEKISFPLLCIALPLMALGSILAGSFRRGGFALRMTFGVGLLVFVQVVSVIVASTVKDNWAAWPLMYLPVVISLAISLVMIHLAARNRSAGRVRSALA